MVDAPLFTAGIGLLGAAYLAAFLRLVRGPGSADRIVALDLISTLTIGAIMLYTIATENAAYLRAGIVLALIGFMGVVALSRMLSAEERR